MPEDVIPTAPEIPEGGVSASVAMTSAPVKPDALSFIDLIPEPFRQEEFIQNIDKSDKEDKMAELLNQFKGAQKLVGEKAGLKVPGDDATPEQRKEFYKALGAPDTVDGYQVTPIEWSEEDKAIGQYLSTVLSEPMVNQIKEAALANGITPKQFQALAETFDKGFIAEHKEFAKQVMQIQADADKEFELKATKAFGDKKDHILATGKKLLDSSIPDNSEVRQILNSMSADQLVGVAAVAYQFTQQHLREGNFNPNGATGGMSASEHERIGQELLAHPALKDVTHAQHEAYRLKVKQHYKNIPKDRLK